MPITWLHCYGQEKDLLDSFLLCRLVQHESFVLFIVGHGRSEGEPVQISSFDNYAADVLKHMDEKLVNHGGLPIFLFGHSMASFHPPLFNWRSSLEVIRWRRKEMGNLSVWYIIKQLFTSVLVKVVDIYLAASGLGKYPLLSASTLMNNCLLWSCEADLVLRLQALLILVKICPSVSNLFCNVRLFIQIIFCVVYSHTGSSQCHGFDS